MDTIEINNALQGYDGYVGCFPRDQLPRRVARGSGVVINTDNASGLGQHWVAFHLAEDGSGHYFDPLGETVPDNEIADFVLRHSGLDTVMNNVAYQANDSERCGEFCVFFLRNRLGGGTLCELHAALSMNSGVNDPVVSLNSLSARVDAAVDWILRREQHERNKVGSLHGSAFGWW